MIFKKNKLLILIQLIFFCFLINAEDHENKVYKAGLPHVPGFMFRKVNGSPGGFPVEILDYAAKAAQIKIEWVDGSWTELFEKLKKSEIDILPGTQRTKDRMVYLDFITSSLYVIWSELYIRKDTFFADINSIKGKKIGLVSNDRNAKNFNEYIRDFDISFSRAEFLSHENAYAALVKGDVYAVPGPASFSGKFNNKIKSSGLFFKPTQLSIAFPKGTNKKLQKILSEKIISFKNNPSSIFYELKNQYVISEFKTPPTHNAKFFINIAIIAIIVIIIIVSFLILLKNQVKLKTRELFNREFQLKKSQETIQLAIQNACLGLWEYDVKDKQIKISESWQQITAINTEAEFIALDEWLEKIHPEDREKTKSCLNEYLTKKNSRYEAEYRYNHPERGYIWIRSVGSKDSLEDSDRMLGFIQDIDDYRQLIKQLSQAQKMESVGQLAGGIAHDFNNMLSGIMGFAELLSTKLKDQPPLQECCLQIIQASERAEELISQLLTYARKGKQVHSNVDIHESISSAVNILSRTIDKNIRIISRLDAEKTIISGDPSLIQTAVLNLAINARDAMPDGGDFIVETKVIHLNQSYCDSSSFDISPGEYISVKISDTGTGIPKDIISKIFDPFFTTKDIGKGTGLGLSVVHGTVISHNGSINIFSTPEKGTTFQIFLPLKDKQDKVIPSPTPVIDKSSDQKRILIVDDERLIRAMADAILTDLGFKTILAENGSDALEIFKKEHDNIDIILLDVMMPVMGGIDALKKIRQIDPEVDIIVVSGYTYQQRIEDIEDERVVFLKKPFRARELSNVIQKLNH